jgi:hypothetical protein
MPCSASVIKQSNKGAQKINNAPSKKDNETSGFADAKKPAGDKPAGFLLRFQDV